MRKNCVRIGLVALLLTAAVLPASHSLWKGRAELRLISSAVAEEPQGRKTASMDAVKLAAEKGKYLFIFFYKDDDPPTSKMRAVFDAAAQKIADKAEWISVNITDPSEKGIVDRFGVSDAPMPLALAVAPNGILTGGFPKEFTEQHLLDAIAGPCLLKCLKALQEQKVAVVCVQGKVTKSNAEAMKGVEDFKADAWYGGLVEIVPVDPADTAEEKLLAQLQITPKQEEAVTVLIAPPGRIIGRFTGATDKNMLVNAYMNASGLGGCGTCR